MNKNELELIKSYLHDQGLAIQNYHCHISKKSRPRQIIKELIEKNEHPLIKAEIIELDLENNSHIPNSFIATQNGKMHLIKKAGHNEYLVEGGGNLPNLSLSECFSVHVRFCYADPLTIAKTLIKRTPPASLFLLVLVAFVMASPIYSNLFNSRLVYGESVSSLIIISLLFIFFFTLEYFIKEWIMNDLNRRIETESRISEDVFFNKVINCKHKDAIIHWKTATESIVAIWKSAGHIGLELFIACIIMIAFMFMLGIYAVFPIVIYVLFFIVQIWMKMKAYRKILTLNQLKDQKLSYLIGMEKGKQFFKFINVEKIRKRWMLMTDDISVFNLQIQEHEEKAGGILKLFSSTSIVIIFIAAYFAIQMGSLQQSVVIALMLLNGRCSGAISAASSRIYQVLIANSKMVGAINVLHQEDNPSMYELGVNFNSLEVNQLSAKNIALSYTEKAVFSEITLFITQGMSLSIIGTAGSGKTSLLKVLSGYIPPSAGLVFFNNVAPHEYDFNFFKEHVAYYSPEDRFIADTLGFNASLKFGGNISNFLELLKYFGADFALNQNTIHGESIETINLSSGQYQLLKMICSLGNNPSMIIFDEPCSHLSPLEAKKFMEKLRLRFPRSIIIFSSHSMILSKQADLILDMNKKTLVENKSKLV